MAKIRKNASIESGLMEVLKILSDDDINKAIGKTTSYIRKCSNPDLAQKVFLQHLFENPTSLHGLLTPFISGKLTPQQFGKILVEFKLHKS